MIQETSYEQQAFFPMDLSYCIPNTKAKIWCIYSKQHPNTPEKEWKMNTKMPQQISLFAVSQRSFTEQANTNPKYSIKYQEIIKHFEIGKTQVVIEIENLAPLCLDAQKAKEKKRKRISNLIFIDISSQKFPNEFNWTNQKPSQPWQEILYSCASI